MRVQRQARIIILGDFMVVLLILGVAFRSESTAPKVTLLQCRTLSSHEFPLLDKQGSYERARGTFRTSINGRRLFLVCTDRVSHQLNLRAARGQDDRVGTRMPDPE